MARPKSDIAPRIVHAARTRFLEDGVDGASLRRIARDAHTNIGMIYYYFPSKDDLFLAVVEEIYERILADVEVTLKTTSRFEDRVRGMYARLYAMSETEVEVIRLVAREALSSSARLERLIQRFRRGHIALMLETVAAGMRDGALDRSLHPALVGIATLIIGGVPTMIQRVAADRLGWVGLPKGEEFANQLLSILLHGVSAKTPAASAANRTTEE
jgi:AcrR family transcriptional regulator